MWDLVPRPRIEPLAPCTGSAESCPLDHQGSTSFLECLLSTLSWLSSTYPSWPWFHYYFLRKAFWNRSLNELLPIPPLDNIVLLQVARTYLFVCLTSHSSFCINKLCVIRYHVCLVHLVPNTVPGDLIFLKNRWRNAKRIVEIRNSCSSWLQSLEVEWGCNSSRHSDGWVKGGDACTKLMEQSCSRGLRAVWFQACAPRGHAQAHEPSAQQPCVNQGDIREAWWSPQLSNLGNGLHTACEWQARPFVPVCQR